MAPKGMGPLAVAVLVLAAGCTGSTERAHASLSKVTTAGVDPASVGTVDFSVKGGKMSIVVTVSASSGLAAGNHGVHIHQNGECGPGPASATNSTVVAAGKAGPHFNPANLTHPHHAGDLGNILIVSDGSGRLSLGSSELQAALNLKSGDALSVVGRSVVVHAKVDDLATDPSGNSGGRALCGAIAQH